MCAAEKNLLSEISDNATLHGLSNLYHLAAWSLHHLSGRLPSANTCIMNFFNRMMSNIAHCQGKVVAFECI